MVNQKLVELKNKMNKKRPKFSRQDAGQKKKLGFEWRKPKGLHHKMRHQKRGHKIIVKVGYRTPLAVRDTNKEGKRIVLIKNLGETKNIEKKNDIAIISAELGTKKKLEIIKELLKEKVAILNLKDPEKYVQTIEEEANKKKQAQKQKIEKRSEKKKEAEKKKHKDEKKKEAKEMSEEEKKKEDKKEKDHTLIHNN